MSPPGRPKDEFRSAKHGGFLMTFPRVVAAEALDTLAPHDPRAIRSRRDLWRIHRAMGTQSIVTTALRDLLGARPDAEPLQVLELGAGDGRLMLGVARVLANHSANHSASPRIELTLLDRQRLVAPATIAGYAALGWNAVQLSADVADWAGTANSSLTDAPHWDLIIANLFMHHFEGASMASLLAAIAQRCDRFFACEPRRAWLALASSRLVGAIGANSVTRQDAVLSVHAGFRDHELSALWPGRAADWAVEEYSAGLFSHCFRARRRAASGAAQSS